MEKTIEIIKNSAQYLEEAVKHYREAAKYHKAGNHEKAASCILKAQKNTRLASKV